MATPTFAADPLEASPGASHTISPTFVGFNGNLTSYSEPWSNDDLVEGTKALNAGTVRFPAGSLGNIWDWDRGWVFAAEGPGSIDYDKTIKWTRNVSKGSNRYSLENLAEGFRKVGFEPVYMLNVIHYEPSVHVEHLKKAESLGLPVKLLELGNELYFGAGADSFVTDKYPSPAAYAEGANDWAKQLKEAFPDARVAAVASSGGLPHHSERRRFWNKESLHLLDRNVIDAITVHTYVGHGLDGFFDTNNFENGGVSEGGNRMGTPDYQRAIYAKLQTPQGVAAVLAQPYIEWERLMKKADLPDDLPIWLTEFNIDDRVGVVRNTWAHGLLIAGTMDAFLDSGRVELVHFHNITGGNLYPAMWNESDGFQEQVVNPDLSPTKRGELSAAGMVMSMFGQAMNGRDTAIHLELDSPTIAASDATYDAVSGWAFEDSQGEVVDGMLFLNFSDKPITVKLSGDHSGMKVDMLQGEPATMIARMRHLQHDTATLDGDSIELPAYSVTTVTKD